MKINNVTNIDINIDWQQIETKHLEILRTVRVKEKKFKYIERN